MKNTLNFCLRAFCKAIGGISLLAANMAVGTLSLVGIYEPEMPAAIKSKDEESETEES